MGRKTSVYLADAVDDRVKASGVPLGVLVERGLDWSPVPPVSAREVAEETAAAIEDRLARIVRPALADAAGGGY